ncbi:hypothetical protein DFS34DRAFT_224593 [Phlyctochytrium arcticum]|nr:hypothetical protein DFS34DRAFT_224593 [Phlyctochytrium arcticum]
MVDPKTTSSALSRLPTELLAKIAGDINDDETLRALSTVSHAWNQVAQPLLFRSIDFRTARHSPSQVQLLLKTLGRKTKLASSVRELRLVGTKLDFNSCLTMKDGDLLAIVEKCKSLDDLSIAMCDKITSTGFGKILPYLTNVRKLNIADIAKLDDDYLRDIAKMCPLLENLDVWRTSVTRTGISSIGAC